MIQIIILISTLAGLAGCACMPLMEKVAEAGVEEAIILEEQKH